MVLPTDLIGIRLGLSHIHIMRLHKESLGWLTLIRLSYCLYDVCLGGYVKMQLHGYPGIRIGGIVARRYTAKGHAAFWCIATRHWAVGCRLYIPCF